MDASQLFHAHSEVAASLETLISRPEMSIRDEDFLDRFAKLKSLLNETFDLEKTRFRQMGIPESEWHKHSKDHKRLMLLLLGVYGDSMEGKKKSAADIYLTLKAELTEHFRQHDSLIMGE